VVCSPILPNFAQFCLAVLRQCQVIVQGQRSIVDGFAWMGLMAWSGICWISYERGGL